MSTSYIAYPPEQQQLPPNALQDWLPQGHLAYFINDTVDGLDLSAFHARYAAGGSRNQPFHPAMMSPEIPASTEEHLRVFIKKPLSVSSWT
jgi:transposase